jgi:hypothetical protein
MEKIEVIAPTYTRKIREISCKESTSPSEQKSASFLIGRPHSPLSRGRVRLINLKKKPPITHNLILGIGQAVCLYKGSE